MTFFYGPRELNLNTHSHKDERMHAYLSVLRHKEQWPEEFSSKSSFMPETKKCNNSLAGAL